ncbi:MAG TPA: glycosyltransferase family 4 protein [Solirubrobacteraceae bacterium]
MILFLHNRYRTTGGEERAVDDLAWLVREHLDEDVEVLARDSAALGRARAARGLLRGGLDEGDVAAAVRRTGARVVHAHNLLPQFGWRALAAAREAGARTVLHLHNYRLVCAVGTCFTKDGDCTRCHGRDTWPGVRLNCRGTGPEAAVYGVALARHQAAMTGHADAVVVPSAFAERRLRELGAPLPAEVHVVPHVVRAEEGRASGAEGRASGAEGRGPGGERRDGGPALVASRLAREKGVDVAIEACRIAGIPLVVAGDGPLRADLERRADGADVRFAGRVSDDELRSLRAEASLAIVPSRSAETFGLAAAEAMAAGLPVVATDIGALPELLPAEQLAPPGDAAALAALATTLRGDRAAGERGREKVRRVASPDAVAPRLRAVYDDH